MNERLAGHVAVVTGAGRGIGEAIAERFADEGAAVAIAELDATTGAHVARRLRASGHRAAAYQVDVTDLGQMESIAAAVAAELGPPDVLVSNAGIDVFADPLELTAEEWRRCFALDLDGAWHAARVVLPYMLEVERGSIVNVASVQSFQIISHCFPYPVAKHGLIGLTRALAIEYASRGIRVNAVCPSYVETQIVVDHFATFSDPLAERSRVADLHPLKRIGRPADIAAAALFLASDECSFITGEAVMVDGGRSVLFHDVP